MGLHVELLALPQAEPAEPLCPRYSSMMIRCWKTFWPPMPMERELALDDGTVRALAAGARRSAALAGPHTEGRRGERRQRRVRDHGLQPTCGRKVQRAGGHVNVWEGECIIAVSDAVRLTPQLALNNPVRLRDAPSDGHRGFRKGQCKLEWLRLLLRQGWTLEAACPEWHTQEQALLMPADALSRPEMYLK